MDRTVLLEWFFMMCCHLYFSTNLFRRIHRFGAFSSSFVVLSSVTMPSALQTCPWMHSNLLCFLSNVNHILMQSFNWIHSMSRVELNLEQSMQDYSWWNDSLVSIRWHALMVWIRFIFYMRYVLVHPVALIVLLIPFLAYSSFFNIGSIASSSWA